MNLLLTNATLIDLDPISVRNGWLRIQGDTIAETGEGSPPEDKFEERFDCQRRLIMPGLVLGHTHLYSALAAGMPAPARTPGNFREILELIWWKLDEALDSQSVRLSAVAAGCRAALCGVTTIIDHHASPNSIAGSLDEIRAGLDAVGQRGVLCYEVTDRHGAAGREAGLTESRRFLQSCASSTDHRFAALVGGHASFTLSDEALASMARLCDEFSRGAHIHCAEAVADDEESLRLFGAPALERLERHGLVRPGTILAHCTHLSAEKIRRVQQAGAVIAHNPRSNMNNQVGYANTSVMREGPVVLGTDGIDGDLFAESATAYFQARNHRSSADMADVVRWIAESARFASQSLGVTLGRLTPGAAADIVLLDNLPAQPVHTDNFLGHWFFGLGSRHVESVMARGQWIVRNREIVSADALHQLENLPTVARRVWEKFARL